MTRPKDISEYRYSNPVWWAGFCRGRAGERDRARNEAATWREAEWQRGAAVDLEGVEQ